MSLWLIYAAILIAPVRAFARSGPRQRILITALSALLTFGYIYAQMTFIAVRGRMGLAAIPYPYAFVPEGVSELIDDAEREMWIRQMIPGSSRTSPCYTTEYECQRAEEFLTRFRRGTEQPIGTAPLSEPFPDDGGILIAVICGLVVTPVNIYFVRRFTRSQLKKELVVAFTETPT